MPVIVLKFRPSLAQHLVTGFNSTIEYKKQILGSKRRAGIKNILDLWLHIVLYIYIYLIIGKSLLDKNLRKETETIGSGTTTKTEGATRVYYTNISCIICGSSKF